MELFAKGSFSSRSSYSAPRTTTTTRSTSTRSSTSTQSKTSSRTTTTTKPKAKAGDKIKTSSGKTIKTSSKKPANTKYKNQQGIVGQDGYTPRFTNGYVAPAGSVVYYQDHSMLDYLPWIYLFSQNSPQHDQVVVVQPDNKQVQVQPEPQGVDGLAVLNWIMLIAIGLAVISGIVWGVNRLTRKE